MFYIFANLFNVWLNRRGLDSHESTFKIMCYLASGYFTEYSLENHSEKS